MIRPRDSLAHAPSRQRFCRRQGFTLVELLVATTLTLMLMAVVAVVFGMVGKSINDARTTLEMADRLRATGARLQKDLEGATVTTLPPRRPGADEGCFEITEGPVGPFVSPDSVAFNNDMGGSGDTTVGDFDDILLFTTRSLSQPFVGKFLAGSYTTTESPVAEIAWFVRGRTLYRRVLLVLPNPPASLPGPGGFYNSCDISVHNQGGTLVANTLGDLAKPENRFAHQPGGYPFHPHFATGWSTLGLPTLRECSHPTWVAGGTLPSIALTARGALDFWINPHPWNELDPASGTLVAYMNTNRVAEDVILTNVIGFDVKVWDPLAPLVNSGGVALMPGDPGYSTALSGGGTVVGYGAYVDLNYAGGAAATAYGSVFDGLGDPRSGLTAGTTRVYDTWSFHYEHDGIDQNGGGLFDEGTDGFDNGGVAGIVDDPGERETSPPYPVQLRGIQVKIRVFEPDSRQIREMTVVQDFLPK